MNFLTDRYLHTTCSCHTALCARFRRIALPAKNLPQAHFPNAKTFSGSSPVKKKQPTHKCELFLSPGTKKDATHFFVLRLEPTQFLH